MELDKIDKGEIDIYRITIVFAKNLKLFIILPIIAFIIGYIHANYLAKPKYTSVSKILSGSGAQTQISGIASQLGLSLPGSQSEKKWIYPEIIRSRTLAKRVLKREFYSPKFDSTLSLYHILNLNKNKKLPDKTPESLETRAVNKFLKMIRVNENLKTGINTVQITADEKTFAFTINKILLEELELHQKQYNRDKSIETRIFIENRIKDSEKQLVLAEEKLKKFRERNRQIANSPNLLLEEQRIVRDVSVLTSVFTTLKQQYETSKIEEVKDSEFMIILDPPEKPLIHSSPNERLIIIAWIFLSSILCILISLVKDFIETGDNDLRNKWLTEVKALIRKNINELFFKKIINK